jgi:anaerobic ribonucleoside-triphosphate reductase activating protein
VVRVADVQAASGVLGPGVRAVIWVAGCSLRCSGCIAPGWQRSDAGADVGVDVLAKWAGEVAVDGLTLSGGEPFLQAAALSRLVRLLRTQRPGLSVMSYSGFRLETLTERGTSEQRALLELLDVLVDGPYVEARHRPLRWRASDNQRIHFLTPRHADCAGELDEPAGLELAPRAEGDLLLVGVPPLAGMADTIAAGFGDGRHTTTSGSGNTT